MTSEIYLESLLRRKRRARSKHLNMLIISIYLFDDIGTIFGITLANQSVSFKIIIWKVLARCYKNARATRRSQFLFEIRPRHGGMTRSYEECNHGCVYYIS